MGIVGIGFGAYFGVILQAKLLPGLHSRKLAGETWWKPILRLLIGVLMILPFGLLYLLNEDQIKNQYVLMMFRTFVPTFAAGMILFCFMDQVSLKLGLL